MSAIKFHLNNQHLNINIYVYTNINTCPIFSFIYRCIYSFKNRNIRNIRYKSLLYMSYVIGAGNKLGSGIGGNVVYESLAPIFPKMSLLDPFTCFFSTAPFVSTMPLDFGIISTWSRSILCWTVTYCCETSNTNDLADVSACMALG